MRRKHAKVIMKKTAFFLAAFLFFWSAITSSAVALKASPSLDRIAGILAAHKIKYHIFANVRGNRFLVVPEFGARILAVSVGGDNILWVDPDVLKGQGGQRTWLGPEGGPKAFILKPDWKGFHDFSMLDPRHYEVGTLAENKILGISNNFRAVSNDGQETYDA